MLKKAWRNSWQAGSAAVAEPLHTDGEVRYVDAMGFLQLSGEAAFWQCSSALLLLASLRNHSKFLPLSLHLLSPGCKCNPAVIPGWALLPFIGMESNMKPYPLHDS